MGCAVGRTSFDLTPAFKRVVGLDFSHAFIAAANKLKATGSARYRMTVEGDVTSEHTATVPSSAIVERASFIQGDACNLPPTAALAALGAPGGKFSVIHGANLLCRLPEPRDFLRRLPSLLVPGGLVVLISPYSWLKQYTPRENWIGELAARKAAVSQGCLCQFYQGWYRLPTNRAFPRHFLHPRPQAPPSMPRAAPSAALTSSSS